MGVSVPLIKSLGIVGVQGLGGPPGIAEVVDPGSGWMPAPSDRLVFCEGFARGTDTQLYAWEVWTRDEMDRVSEMDDEAHPGRHNERIVAHVCLGDAEAEIRATVLEWIDDSGWRWTQVILAAPWFGAQVLESLRVAAPEHRGLFFSLLPSA